MIPKNLSPRLRIYPGAGRISCKGVINIGISLYFGLPGSGKTTLLAKIACETDRKIENGKKCPYQHIYGNVHFSGLKHYTYIEFSDLGIYDIRNALILIDEATIEADSRDYKTFSRSSKMFFLMHRHYNVDVVFATQQWDGIDKKIRVITDRVFYIYKKGLLRHWFTRMYRVPYGIIIPDPRKSDGEKLGEIIQGYCKPSFFVRLFSPRIFRPKYYKYFDSWEAPRLPDLSTKAQK